MYHNRYTQAVSKIKAPEGAVEKMLKTAESFEKKEKVIHMKKWIKLLLRSQQERLLDLICSAAKLIHSL